MYFVWYQQFSLTLIFLHTAILWDSDKTGFSFTVVFFGYMFKLTGLSHNVATRRRTDRAAVQDPPVWKRVQRARVRRGFHMPTSTLCEHTLQALRLWIRGNKLMVSNSDSRTDTIATERWRTCLLQRFSTQWETLRRSDWRLWHWYWHSWWSRATLVQTKCTDDRHHC